jgi:hypothetical protein
MFGSIIFSLLNIYFDCLVRYFTTHTNFSPSLFRKFLRADIEQQKKYITERNTTFIM